MQQITLGIVLLPDVATERYVKRLASRVKGNVVAFADPPFVHLSLLHFVVEEEAVSRTIDLFASLTLPPLPLAFLCVGSNRIQSGWCFLEVEHTKALLELQKAVLPLVKLRVADTSFTWRGVATPAQVAAHETYGYPNIGPIAWSPHFTYGKTSPRTRAYRRVDTHRGTFERAALVEIVGEASTANTICAQRF